MRRLLLALLLLAAALPASAGAAPTLQPLQDADQTDLRPFAGPMHDSVLHTATISGPGGATGLEAFRLRGHYYVTKRGHVRILVAVSSSYRNVKRSSIQSYANYFGTLLHGSELRRLKVGIVTPGEIASNCGKQALACYDPGYHVLLIPGQQTPAGQPPLAFVIAHEYGHHIASFRSNYPFSAGAWGPKHWATAEHVCPLYLFGKAFPGDEGKHYRANPGEAWAESYARYRFRSAPWHFASYFEPGRRIYPVIRTDVTKPWHGARHQGFLLRFGPHHRRVRHFTLRTPLDGLASIRVHRSRGARRAFLRVYANGHLLAPARTRPLRRMPICGYRRLQLRVTLKRGRGLVRISYARP